MRVEVLTPIKYAGKRWEIGEVVEMDNPTAMKARRDGLVVEVARAVEEAGIADADVKVESPAAPPPKPVKRARKKGAGDAKT